MDARNERDFAQVYPFLLLHAAQLHPLDLRRQLGNWRGPDGNVRVSLERARSWPGYKYELLVQLAIEHILDSEQLASQLERDPTFRRLAYDALYYPSRRWEKDLKLDLRESGREEFEDYLLERMQSESDPHAATPLYLNKLVTPNQRKLLFDSLKHLARMLA